MVKTLLTFLVLLVFPVSPAPAGQQVKVYCSNPGCDYQTALSIGGGRLSPSITCYCPRCHNFVRLKLASWSEYRGQRYNCPGCGGAAEPIYSAWDLERFPCPRCGHLTLKTKAGPLFD